MATKILDISQLNFLVIDDNPYMRLILRTILMPLGGPMVKEAEDGASGLQVLKTFPVDIVLVNWMMQPIDGIEFTHSLRTASDTPNPMLPVIMLSGHTEPKRVAEARDAGVTDFLSKPVSPKALYLRIEQVILRPRQFVRAKAFEGPDRRRHRDDKYSGRRRRQADDPTIAPATGITPDADE